MALQPYFVNRAERFSFIASWLCLSPPYFQWKKNDSSQCLRSQGLLFFFFLLLLSLHNNLPLINFVPTNFSVAIFAYKHEVQSCPVDPLLFAFRKRK